MSYIDIILLAVLIGVFCLILLGGLWALAYRGRKRWSADRADQVVAESMQVITANPGDAVVVTYPGTLTKQQRGQIVEAIERRLPNGVNAMIMDGGLRMSHVVSVSQSP